jgi:hypothetical protein
MPTGKMPSSPPYRITRLKMGKREGGQEKNNYDFYISQD